MDAIYVNYSIPVMDMRFESAIVWIPSTTNKFVEIAFDGAKTVIAKLKNVAKSEVVIHHKLFIGSKLDTIVSNNNPDVVSPDNIFSYKLGPGSILYEATESYMIPIHWLIESVEYRDCNIIYNLVNARTGARKSVIDQCVDVDAGGIYFSDREVAFRKCKKSKNNH